MKKIILIIGIIFLMVGFSGIVNAEIKIKYDNICLSWSENDYECIATIGGETLKINKTKWGIKQCGFSCNKVSFISNEISKFRILDQTYGCTDGRCKEIGSVKNLKKWFFDNDLTFEYTGYKNKTFTEWIKAPQQCYDLQRNNGKIILWLKSSCLNSLNDTQRIRFYSNSYIINYTGGNQSLKINGTFNQTRFNENCFDVELSYPDHDNGSLILDMSFRCNNTQDESIYGNNGTNYGSIWCASCGMNDSGNSSEETGGAFNFDGINDYIDCGSDNSLDLGLNFTLFAWVKQKGDTNSNSGGVITKMKISPETHSWMAVITNDGNIGIFDGIAWKFSSTAYVTNDVWYNVVWVISGGNVYYYLNGELYDSDSFSNNDKSDNNVRIGGWRSINYHFNGTIDEVRIYNRSLSTNEINQHYLNGKSFYIKGNVSYNNIALDDTLQNITINKTRSGEIKIYVNDVEECDLTGSNEFCDITGIYTDTINLTLELYNFSTPSFNEIIIESEIEENCNCATCDICETALNNPLCSTVYLTSDILNQNGTCIDNPTNFSNKTFDCQNYRIVGDNSGYGILMSGDNNIVKNYKFSNFSIGISDPSFISGLQTIDSTINPLLWGYQNNSGDLMNLSGNNGKFIIDNNGNVNISGNLNMQNTNITNVSWLFVDNITGNISVNNYYGGMKYNDGGFSVNCTPNGAFYNITNLTSNNLNGFTFENSSLISNIVGKYHVYLSGRYSDVKDNNLNFALFVNDIKDNDCFDIPSVTKAGKKEYFGFNCFVDLNANDLINIKLNSTLDGMTEIYKVDFNLFRIGN